nr:UDP-3-O-(3-hydroxymyristoyl)glucosamine N-acyltransferase [Bacillota bacterium]
MVVFGSANAMGKGSKIGENKVQLTLEEIAKMLGLERFGPADLVITGVSAIEAAGEGDISFVTDRRHLSLLDKTAASAVIVFEGIEECRLPHIVSPNPYLSFVKLVNIFHPTFRPEPGISQSAAVSEEAQVASSAAVGAFSFIDAGASIGPDSVIYPQVYIGRNVKIGRDTVIKPQVSILDDTVIGDRCIVHSGAVIGSDGYGFINDKGRHVKIPQIGNVVIGDDVEVGASVAIDRATFGSTMIGSGCKIDNLVHVAHNVTVGKNTLLVAQVGIAGSTSIGNNCTLAGQVGVAGHISIGDNVIAASKAGIPRDIPDGSVVGGIPAVSIDEWRRQVAGIIRLPKLMSEVRELKKQVKMLTERLGQSES